MLISIVITVVVLLVALAVVVSLQPAAFSVSRSTSIAAEPGAVFDHVNDFHKWETWSPWEKIDSTMKKNYEGPASGVGAVYNWSGSGKAGAGRMTLNDSRPGERVGLKLEMLKPMKATNSVVFTFVPQGDKTVTSWTMSGEKGFISKAFCMVMDMDKMVGGDFEKGLVQLKAVAESTAAHSAAGSAV